MDFCLLLKIWVKISAKVEVKAYTANIVKTFLIYAKESATDSFKTVLKRVNQKTEEAAGDLIC